LATLRLRDRDAITTKEGLIFRVFGYTHPPNAYICDAEYASSKIFKSDNPKAFRTDGKRVFYKFYEDEGWKFIKSGFPQHMFSHDALRSKVVGVERRNIAEVRKPEEALRKLIGKEPKDELLNAMQGVLKIVTKHARLSVRSFGVFGSLLHGFYHPKFSDIDLIVYGGKNAAILREALRELYRDRSSQLRNEFESDEAVRGKSWRFQNYSPEEFAWHQRRKLIYGLFIDEKGRRVIKTEFEPVKDWSEISNEYDPKERIVKKGWVKMFARVTEDGDAPFIPSVYGIEPLNVLAGKKDAGSVRRVVSYMEEFRMQAQKGEKVYVEGNLEEVTTPKGSYHQIMLTYCPRYYEQVLKAIS
jgi:predicted nucleotidyltransferase